MFGYLERFYNLMVATGRQPEESRQQWVAQTRIAIAQQKVDLWPICQPGGTDMIGGVLFAGDTVHLLVHPDWHGLWVTRKLRRAYDTWTPACAVKAPIRHDNPRAAEFARRLGFKFVSSDGHIDIYEKEPYAAPTTPR